MKKYLFLFIVLMLINACAIKLANINELQVKSLNSNWKVKSRNLDYIQIYFYNTELPNIEISIDNLAVRDESLNLFLPVPIPYKTINGDKENCNNNFPIIFYTQNIKNREVIEFLKNNVILFDTNKTFIIKNDKQYKIDGGDGTLNISEILLKKYEQAKFKDWDIYYARLFISPIGCKALEGATLVIDGLYLNDKELPPIEIKLSYLKDNK